MKWKAHLSGIGFATIFGCSFLASKVTLDFLSPLGLLSFRFLIAFVTFEILRLTKVIHIRFTKQVIRLVWWVVLFQPILYFLFETYGLHFSSSSEAGMMIALIPIVVALLSCFILKEKPTLLQWGCIILSIVGILIIETMGVGVSGSNNGVGFLLLFGAVVAAAFFNILSRKASQELRPMEITYFMMLGGAIVFNGMNIVDHFIYNSFTTYFNGLSNPIVLIALLYLGIASSVIAFFLVNYSLSKLTAPISSLYSNLSTVITIFMGVLFLQESLTIYHIIGSIMIILGVYLSTALKPSKVV